MRFGPDSDERSCDREVPHPGINGSFACLRRAGHDGDCIALARDAALADGVCFYCRRPIGTPHGPSCRQA